MANWSVDDTLWLRNLLSQPSGQKLIAELRSMLPKIKAQTRESAWIQAVEKQGEESMLDKLLGLAHLDEPTLKEGKDYIDLNKEGD